MEQGQTAEVGSRKSFAHATESEIKGHTSESSKTSRSCISRECFRSCSIETRSLPNSLTASLAALPSMSLIPFAPFAEIAAERFIGSSLSNRPKPAATRRCMHDLRDKLVDLALSWEQAFGNAPHITAALSEFDAAQLVGCSIDQYCKCMRGGTSVRRGHDFQFNGRRYQVKANRPSGKPGSFVTLVPKVRNYDWDVLVWILYDKSYQIEEAWLWEVEPYRKAFESIKRLSPIHYRQGKRLQ